MYLAEEGFEDQRGDVVGILLHHLHKRKKSKEGKGISTSLLLFCPFHFSKEREGGEEKGEEEGEEEGEEGTNMQIPPTLSR